MNKMERFRIIDKNIPSGKIFSKRGTSDSLYQSPIEEKEKLVFNDDLKLELLNGIG